MRGRAAVHWLNPFTRLAGGLSSQATELQAHPMSSGRRSMIAWTRTSQPWIRERLDDELEKLIEALATQGAIAIQDGKVTYTLTN